MAAAGISPSTVASVNRCLATVITERSDDLNSGSLIVIENVERLSDARSLSLVRS